MMENKTLTAVEWLLEQVNGKGWGDFRIDIPKEIVDQAKEMERDQIIEAWSGGKISMMSGENYYRETYEETYED